MRAPRRGVVGGNGRARDHHTGRSLLERRRKVFDVVNRRSRLRALKRAPERGLYCATATRSSMRVCMLMLPQRCRLRGTVLLRRQLRIELATGWVEGENIAIPRSAREGRLLLGRQAREVASAWA